MRRRVLVGRVVTAAHVAAHQATPGVHPAAADTQTFFAAVGRARAHVADLVEMGTALRLFGGHAAAPTWPVGSSGWCHTDAQPAALCGLSHRPGTGLIRRVVRVRRGWL